MISDFIAAPPALDSPCSTCDVLFAHRRDALDDAPLFQDIKTAADAGCLQCENFWEGIHKANLTAAGWPRAVAFCTIIASDGYQWLRIGIKNFGVGYLNGVPREWIDFFNKSDEFE